MLGALDAQKPHLVQGNDDTQKHRDPEQSGVDRRENAETGCPVANQPGLAEIEGDIDEAGRDDEGLPSLTPRAHQEQMSRGHEDDGHDEEVKVRRLRELRRFLRKLHALFIACIVGLRALCIEAGSLEGHVDGKGRPGEHEHQEVGHDQLGVQVHAGEQRPICEVTHGPP